MSQLTTSSLTRSLDLVELTPSVRFSEQALREILVDVETTLFFGKVFELDAHTLSMLLTKYHNSPLVEALLQGEHSTDLQTYIVDIVPDAVERGVVFASDAPPPKGEILPEVWKSLNVTVAQSIKDVASKLSSTVHLMPGKQGRMLMKSMMTMNRRRPTIGDHQALVHHDRQQQNLVILDVSGSMTEHTVRQIIDDVVALSYEANAHLAIVSNDTFHWEPGTYTADAVLQQAQFGGTHYESLVPLLQGTDWGVVVTIADYDSSTDAFRAIGKKATSTIGEVVDISLVYRPTYLAECVGQLASKVTPVLIGQGYYPMT